VTFDLKDLGTAKVSLTRDNEAVTKLVQDVVEAYNSLNTKIAALQKTSLKTDSSLSSIKNAFLAEIGKPAQLDGLKNLFEVGITRDRSGKFSLDATKLKSALEQNSDQVMALFGDKTSGFATRLSDLAKSMTGNEGIFKSRETGLNDRLKFLQDSESRMQARLDEAQARMKKQFSNLDVTMSKLNSTGSYLSSQLMAMY
jgi:flagellar hook-associated protein 2